MSHEVNVSAEPDYGTGQKNFIVYAVGIVLCAILTLIPFYMVMAKHYAVSTLLTSIFICAIIQFFVQVLCFLRLNTKNEQGRMNVMVFMFTIVILLAVVVGSIWIMWHLNYNMMM